MEIKVKYQGQVVGEIVFAVFSAIERMREMGYASFSVRGEVTKHEYFAVFRNEETEDCIHFYPDLSFMKSSVYNDCKVTHEELYTIIDVLGFIAYKSIEEESEVC